jgi:hypothetical protein
MVGPPLGESLRCVAQGWSSNMDRRNLVQTDGCCLLRGERHSLSGGGRPYAGSARVQRKRQSASCHTQCGGEFGPMLSPPERRETR